ncbi:type II secretion system protein M [Candidatus Poribacteria bacterium]|nr:type II secretion system protein M [Candidatus Poribacteria bacterium]
MTLEKREKFSITICALSLIIFVFYQFIWLPGTEKTKQLESQLINREKDLLQMIELSSRYIELMQKNEKIQSSLIEKNKDFAIFSYLEKLAIEANIKEKITHMKPITLNLNKVYEQDSVEIRLEGVSLENIVAFLYNIEYKNKLIKITQIHIKPKDNNTSLLDVNCLVSSYLNKKKNG